MSNTKCVSKDAQREWRREYRRLLNRGQHKDWMRNAFVRAGGSPLDWPSFRKETA